ncbi:hypothetical protein NKH77_04810 [Streptomyces sp. M19]
MRHAQRLLDEAQASRSRTLAAFAVTVGSDEAIAELLGLQQREVRVARRTVGKDDARAVARNLLTQPMEETPAPRTEPEETVNCLPEPGPVEEVVAPSHAAPSHAAPPHGPVPPFPAQPPSPPPMPPVDAMWSPALDAVLVGGWHAGVDLSVLAAELGLDLAHLVARAQHLSAEGRLTPQTQQDRSGRHRRADATTANAVPPEQQQMQWHEPEQYDTQAGWQQYPTQTTLPSHDWDGILSQWENASSIPQPVASWDQHA